MVGDHCADLTPPYNHDPPKIHLLRAEPVVEHLKALLGGHDVKNVARMEHRLTGRNDEVVIPQDDRNEEGHAKCMTDLTELAIGNG